MAPAAEAARDARLTLAAVAAGAALAGAGAAACWAAYSPRSRGACGRGSRRGSRPLDPSAPPHHPVCARGKLSARAAAAAKPPLSYFPAFMRALADLYDRRRNEGGFIVLTVAENKLPASTGMLKARLSKVPGPTLDTFTYDDMRGTLRLRKAIVSLYRDHIVAPGVELEADRLTVSAGCGAILDNLMFLLAGRGDGVLIPVPYYPAFDNDLTARMGVVPVPVATTSGLLPTPEDLERSARAAAGAGRRIKILLLTNPHNPLGVVYPPDRYEALVRWALERGVHVVSDEIYANSVFGEGEEFRSVISMVPGLRKEYGAEVVDRLVHQVWGFSKDFCASGLRVGCLYSGNRQLLATLDNVSYFAAVSNFTQDALASMLEDTGFVKRFLGRNRAELRLSYETLSSLLEKYEIGFTKADSAMFLMVDLRPALAERTWEAEFTLWTSLTEEAKVILTPGKDCHCMEPGWFRLCYAWVPKEVLAVAADRLYSHLLDRAEAVVSGTEKPPLTAGA